MVVIGHSPMEYDERCEAATDPWYVFKPTRYHLKASGDVSITYFKEVDRYLGFSIVIGGVGYIWKLQDREHRAGSGGTILERGTGPIVYARITESRPTENIEGDWEFAMQLVLFHVNRSKTVLELYNCHTGTYPRHVLLMQQDQARSLYSSFI